MSLPISQSDASIPEIVSPGTGAQDKLLAQIENSISAVKQFMGVDQEIPWIGKLYQFANRLAHLYLLRELNGVDAYLVFVYFIGDDDVSGPSTIAEWKSAMTVVKRVFGISSRNPLNEYVSEVFIDISEL